MNKKEGWEIKKLGDICITTSGGTPNRSIKSYYNGTIPWVKSGELDKGLILETGEKITEEALKNSSAKVFPKGTLLIALYGATIGKLAFLGIDACTNQAICGIFKNDNIDSNFLYYFLYYKKPSLINKGIGGGQPNISQAILKDLIIPLPPLPIQQKIVTKLDTLSDIISKKKQQLADLDKLAQASFYDMFGDPVSNEKGWKTKQLGKISFLKSGQFVKAIDIQFISCEELYPCYGGNGLRGYTKSFTHNGVFVLIGRQGALCGNVKIASDKFHATEHAVVCKPLLVYEPLWLYYVLKTLNLNKYSTGAAQPGLAVSN